MSWQDYFEYDDINECYSYKDKKVVSLPHDLPMPPIIDFTRLFAKCSKLQDITALSSWDTSNVTSMDSMFYDCQRLQDISALANWDVHNVKDMCGMFYVCHQLQDITALANWDVSNVTNMKYMFSQCYQLQDITALSKWNISNVIDTKDMFYGCYREADITTLLGKSDNHNRPIIGESTLMFRWEINELKTHITRLEAKIAELTEIIERK